MSNNLNMDELKKVMQDPMEFDKDSPYHVESGEKKLVDPIQFVEDTKSVEDKIFIVYMVTESNDELFDGYYKVLKGRTATYRYIEHLLQAFGTDFNIIDSKVATETKQTETETGDLKYYMINWDRCASVYAFCKGVEDFYGNLKFDIDYYKNQREDLYDEVEVAEEDTDLFMKITSEDHTMDAVNQIMKSIPWAKTDGSFMNAMTNLDGQNV